MTVDEKKPIKMTMTPTPPGNRAARREAARAARLRAKREAKRGKVER